MEKLHYSVRINAPKEKVWNTMITPDTYSKWTSAFMPGSHFSGSWEQGETITFLALNEDGTASGMISTVVESRPYEFISLEHIGVVKKNIEDTSSDDAKKWSGAHENYTFRESNGITELIVDMDSNPEYTKMFDQMWPQSLQVLKELAEQ